MIIKAVPYTNNIYRGSRPDDFTVLRNLGISWILNLENDPGTVMVDIARADLSGIISVSLPLSEWSRPTTKELRKAVSIISTCPDPLLVHCLHGRDRTGYVIAAYRIIVQGWSLDAAYNECKKEGHKWLFYFWWKKSLKELAAQSKVRWEEGGE